MSLMDLLLSTIALAAVISGVMAVIFAIGLIIIETRRRGYEVQLAPDLRPVMDKPLRKEADLIRRRIRQRFVQLGYRDLDSGEAFIKFNRVVATVDRIYYKISVHQLPDDLRLADLISPANLQEVSVAIEHTIQIHIAPLDGAWLVVCRRGYEEAPETYIPWLEDKQKRVIVRQPPGAILVRQPSGGLVDEFDFDELPTAQQLEKA